MNLKDNPYLQLIRPANLVTAATDILAGTGISFMIYSHTGQDIGSFQWGILLLILSSMCLYAGGITFNDVMDLEIDRVERPERPIPGGRISARKAGRFAALLLLAGILISLWHHPLSAALALAIALLSLVYNKWGKHHAIGGLLNMGIIRGLNLMLGVTIIPDLLMDALPIMMMPIVYIFAVTMVSRGEVHGASVKSLYTALALFLLVDAGILVIAWKNGLIWLPLVFAIIHLAYILPPLFRALKNPVPGHIRLTVKHGVLGIILMDAIWVSLTGYWIAAMAVLLFLPLSQKLSRYFSVT